MTRTSHERTGGQLRAGRRQVLRTLAGMGLLAAAGACGPPAATPTALRAAAGGNPATALPATASPASVVAQPRRGGAFRWANTLTFSTLDPHQTSSVVAFGYGIGVCYSRLLKFTLRGVQLPAFIPTGDLAASWEQADETTYLFKLRPNVRWQNLPPVNGRALVAEDVVYSLDRQRTPGYPNASILEAITRVEAVDRSTVRITTSGPAADFLLNIAAPQSVIIAHEAVDLKGDLREGPLIGTGPFIIEQADRNGTSTARRNPDYFVPGQPYIDTYAYTYIADPAAIIAAFRSNNIDFITTSVITVEEAEALKRTNPNLQVQMVYALGSGNALGFRMDQPPFNDVRVRQAIYKAIDPETIIKTAYGSGWLTVGIPLPAVDWALPQEEISRLYRRDLPTAQRLLREAGRENGFDFTLTVAMGPGVSEAAQLIAAQLSEIGIRVTLKLVDNPTFVQQVQQSREFEAFYGPTQAAPSADAGLFGAYHSRGARNVTRLNDPRLDQLIEQQTLLGRDPTARKRLLLDIQRYILDQGYVHFIYTYAYPAVLQPYVRDLFLGFGALNLEIDRWAQVWLDK